VDTRVYMMELISLFEIELYKSDYALSCLTYSPGGYISNRIGSGLIWKALPDACLFLLEDDDLLCHGRTARLPNYSSQQDSKKVDGRSTRTQMTAARRGPRRWRTSSSLAPSVLLDLSRSQEAKTTDVSTPQT